MKKLEFSSTNSKLKHAKSCLNCADKPDPDATSYGLKVKSKRNRVLFDSGLTGDLLFVKKGSIKSFPLVSML